MSTEIVVAKLKVKADGVTEKNVRIIFRLSDKFVSATRGLDCYLGIYNSDGTPKKSLFRGKTESIPINVDYNCYIEKNNVINFQLYSSNAAHIRNITNNYCCVLAGGFKENQSFAEPQTPTVFKTTTDASYTRARLGNTEIKNIWMVNVAEFVNRINTTFYFFDYFDFIYDIMGNNEVTTDPIKQNVSLDLTSCTSSDISTIEEGKEFEISLNVNKENYFFLQTPTLTYYENNTTQKSLSFTVADDKKSASLKATIETLANGKTAVVKGVATYQEPIDVSADFVYHLTNCEINPKWTKASQVGTNYKATITANDGFVFEHDPTINYTYQDDLEINDTFDVSSDGKTATYDAGLLPHLMFKPKDGTEVIIIANAVGEPISVGIDYNLQNCTSNNVASIVQGVAFSIVLTAKDGFLFESEPTLEYVKEDGTTETLNFTIASGNKSATLTATLTDLKKGSTATVSGNGSGVEPTFTASFDYGGVIHCSVAPKPDTFTQGDDFKMTFVANENYFFNTNVYAMVSFEHFDTPQRFEGVVSDDKRSAYIDFGTIGTVKKGSVIQIFAPAIREVVQYRLSTIFFPTDAQLYELTKKRYYKVQVGQQVSDIQTYDLGEYILSCRKIFVVLPKNDVQEITLGYFQTGIVAEVGDSLRYKVSCGVKSVVGLYENSLDYNNAQIEISLPFVGLQQIDAGKVMNRNILLEYDINVTAGVCCAKLIDNDKDIVLYAFDGVCSINLPYIFGQGSLINGAQVVKGELSVDNKALYQVTPKLTIRQKKVVENENLYGDITQAYGSLSNLTGFAIVENARLDGIDCNDDERTMIAEALAKGCFF